MIRRHRTTWTGGWLLIALCLGAVCYAQQNPVPDLAPETLMFNAPADTFFQLPDNVKGHLQGRLNQFGEVICPSRNLAAGDALLIHFTVVDSGVVQRATPLFVRIHRRETDNRLRLEYQGQFRLRVGKNHIRIIPDFSAGEYELTFGFYFRDQLSQTYPRFYQKRCRITLTE